MDRRSRTWCPTSCTPSPVAVRTRVTRRRGRRPSCSARRARTTAPRSSSACTARPREEEPIPAREEGQMTRQSLEAHRGMNYEIAEAIAPTWENRRADIEQTFAPVREWMIRELRPQEGETVLELAAGTGDTAFEAAASIGERGLLYS